MIFKVHVKEHDFKTSMYDMIKPTIIANVGGERCEVDDKGNLIIVDDGKIVSMFAKNHWAYVFPEDTEISEKIEQ